MSLAEYYLGRGETKMSKAPFQVEFVWISAVRFLRSAPFE